MGTGPAQGSFRAHAGTGQPKRGCRSGQHRGNERVVQTTRPEPPLTWAVLHHVRVLHMTPAVLVGFCRRAGGGCAVCEEVSSAWLGGRACGWGEGSAPQQALECAASSSFPDRAEGGGGASQLRRQPQRSACTRYYGWNTGG